MSDLRINSVKDPKAKIKSVDFTDSPVQKESFFSRWGYMRWLRKIWKSSSKKKSADELWVDHALDDVFSSEEKEIFRNILRFREMRTDDIMIPRADIDAVEDEITICEVMIMLKQFDRSWMPVYRGGLDNPRGMIHARDLLAYVSRITATKISEEEDVFVDFLNTTLAESHLIREVLFVPSSMLVSDLLHRMQESLVKMALVIDEHGGTDGLVSHEDIVEVLIRDIESKHTSRTEIISVSPDNSFIVDARTDLEELAKVMGPDCDISKGKRQDVDSLGGLIFSVLDRIPVCGEIIREIPGFEILILDSDVRCIRRVRIRRLTNCRE
ncbi:transporter associated domain-containing protein [Candidatus Liberibacter sp.]|uniref:transporter associated domain-containing protein n=1 Tax=Candidatus Liberibacter sp. TaxID=34022 RepID=UPI0015F73D73|nr:transporter associated domain-containing protein [Candidatus Liberibacter sp.]MBA5724103.1 CBS domain-containing protein [Candidatus Liberibacter sp.]